MGFGLFSQEKATGQEEMASSRTRGGLDGIYEKFLHRKDGQAQGQAAQGRGGITVPESVQNMCRWDA